MQIKIYTIPIGDNGFSLNEMNNFLRGNKILEVQNQLVSNEHGAYWCFCIKYIESMNFSSGFKEKIDYKTILDEVTFSKFSIKSYGRTAIKL